MIYIFKSQTTNEECLTPIINLVYVHAPVQEKDIVSNLRMIPSTAVIARGAVPESKIVGRDGHTMSFEQTRMYHGDIDFMGFIQLNENPNPYLTSVAIYPCQKKCYIFYSQNVMPYAVAELKRLIQPNTISCQIHLLCKEEIQFFNWNY